MKPLANFPIVDLKDYYIGAKTIHYVQVKHLFEKPKTKNTGVGEDLKETEFDFMIDLKSLIDKTSVYQNL